MQVNGLTLLDKEPLAARGSTRHFPLGTIRGDYFYVGDKPGGVEPGFLGIEINDNFVNYFNERFKVQLGEPIQTVKQCKKWINYLNSLACPNNDLVNLARDCKEACKQDKNNSNNLTMWLFKQDYQDTKRDTVAPPRDRLANTNAMKSIPKLFRKMATAIYEAIRQQNKEIENINAILECAANDVTRYHGMQSQDQRLILSSYEDGHPKILTACKWETGMQPLEGHVAGSGKRTDYEGYFVEDKRGEEDFYQTKSINFAGESLPLFIAQGDRDTLGSKGQNKAIKNNNLFIFDCGQAYRRKNIIIDSLNPDFTFTQPKDETKKFKNFSAFYESSMSERMLGMFYMYQLVDDKTKNSIFSPESQQQINKTIELYKLKYPHFQEKIEDMQKKQLKENQVFDAYIEKFKMLAAQSNNPKHKQQFQRYVEKITAAKQQAIEASSKMLSKFSSQMQMSPDQIELLHNLSKLASQTSEFSSDGQVKLRHLRFLPKHKIYAELEKTNEGIINLKMKISDGQGGNLQKYLQNYFLKNNFNAAITMTNKNLLEIKIHQKDMAHLQAFLKEDNIKSYKQANGNVKINFLSSVLSKFNQSVNSLFKRKEKGIDLPVVKIEPLSSVPKKHS